MRSSHFEEEDFDLPGGDLYDRLPVRPRVLLVEDDDAVRMMLTLALEHEGFAVTAVASAEHGLATLVQTDFDAVLTDYALPGGDGIWMLREAARNGRLEDTPAFIVTGHHDVLLADDYAVIPKPLDLDHLLSAVRRAVESLEAEGRRRAYARAARAVGRDSGRTPKRGDGRANAPIELVLYISSESVHSAAALRNVRQALAQFDGQVTLTVHDLSKEPERGDADGVHFTPALLSRGRGPRTWIVGHLQNPQVIQAILDAASERDH